MAPGTVKSSIALCSDLQYDTDGKNNLWLYLALWKHAFDIICSVCFSNHIISLHSVILMAFHVACQNIDGLSSLAFILTMSHIYIEEKLFCDYYQFYWLS